MLISFSRATRKQFMVATSRAWYNGSYTMAAQPIKTLELHYTMIQFLIISFTCSKINGSKKSGKCSTFKHSVRVAISSKQNDIFTKMLLKCSLQVRHVLMVTGVVTSVLVLYLKYYKPVLP